VSLEIEKLRGEAEAAIDRDRAAAQHAIVARASALSVEIAQRLLESIAPDMALAVFLDGLCRELRALSPEAREAFLSAVAAGHPIEVVTATPLSMEDTKPVDSALKAAIGSELPFAFRTDPALIAGVELHSRNVIMRNSWRGHLDRIRQELNRDEHPHGT
jgi:F-type H+-transporting ATPase subunit b